MDCECKPDRPHDPWAFSPEYHITSRGVFPDTPATDFSRASAEQWTKRSRGRLSMRRILITARQAASGATLTQQTRQRQQAEGEFRGKYRASPVLCSATYNYLKRCNICSVAQTQVQLINIFLLILTVFCSVTTRKKIKLNTWCKMKYVWKRSCQQRLIITSATLNVLRQTGVLHRHNDKTIMLLLGC